MTAVDEVASRDLRHVSRSGNVSIEAAVLFAGHAECPRCGAFVRTLTRLGSGSMIGELVEGWCSVCTTSTFYLAA